MAPTSLHSLIPRNDPSLGEMFHHFPAKVWMLIKAMLFGAALIAALLAILFGGIGLVMVINLYGWDFIRWLRSGEWREVEGWREKAWRLGRIERVNRMWKWLECRRSGGEAGTVDDEELQRLGSHDGDGGEGSVGGETLFEGDEDEDGDGEARKKEEMELNSEDYMTGEP